MNNDGNDDDEIVERKKNDVIENIFSILPLSIEAFEDFSWNAAVCSFLFSFFLSSMIMNHYGLKSDSHPARRYYP